MCQVCDSPQRASIEQDIRAGLAPSPVAKKYGLRHHAIVIQHERRHMQEKPAVLGIVDREPSSKHADIESARFDAVAKPVLLDIVDTQVIDRSQINLTWKAFQLDAAPQVTNNPLGQFQQAWRLAKDDDRMRARMVAWLQDQLRADDMGL